MTWYRKAQEDDMLAGAFEDARKKWTINVGDMVMIPGGTTLLMLYNFRELKTTRTSYARVNKLETLPGGGMVENRLPEWRDKQVAFIDHKNITGCLALLESLVKVEMK